MTDEKIIKALEQCGNIIVSSCKDCPLHEKYNANCVRELTKEALDLIKRQQAEIEHFRDLTKKIKTEAIKEVTAELYNSFAQYETYDRHHTFEILDKIQSVEDFLFDNLVKELTEGK